MEHDLEGFKSCVFSQLDKNNLLISSFAWNSEWIQSSQMFSSVGATIN